MQSMITIVQLKNTVLYAQNAVHYNNSSTTKYNASCTKHRALDLYFNYQIDQKPLFYSLGWLWEVDHGSPEEGAYVSLFQNIFPILSCQYIYNFPILSY